MRVYITLLLLIAALCCIPSAASAAEAPRPNIVWIMADDLGYGDVGCYGQKVIKTPNIDALAAEGLRFTQCYAGSTVCAPSRCALMTGFHTGHARIRSNGEVPLEPQDVTVAEVLHSAGYATGIVGKWGLGEPETTGIPNQQGFDEWFGYLNQHHAHNYFPDYLWRNQEKTYFANWEFPERGFGQAVRLGNWKAIRPKPGEPLELYELSTDLGEEHDVASDHADVLARVEAILETVRTDSPNWPVK